MEVPEFFKIDARDADLSVTIEYGPFVGTHIVASRNDSVIVHRWSNECPDTLEIYSSVREALEEEIDKFNFVSVESFMAAQGGQRYDGCGAPVGASLSAGGAAALREWLEYED